MNNLPYAILGRTNFKITRLGYGAAHQRPMTLKQADEILNSVLDSGINFIDTSPDYGNSEDLIGKFISHRKKDFILASKCGCNPGRLSMKLPNHLWTSSQIINNVESSLKRLKIDALDILQMHNPSVDDCVSGNLVDTLQKLKQQGKIRYFGVSTMIPDLETFLKWNVFDVFQVPYSALEQEHEQWITKISKSNSGTIIRGGIAQGEPVDKPVSNLWQKLKKKNLTHLLENNETLSSLILRFTLTHTNIHTTIVGTTNIQHLQENIEATMKGPLPKHIHKEIQKILI